MAGFVGAPPRFILTSESSLVRSHGPQAGLYDREVRGFAACNGRAAPPEGTPHPPPLHLTQGGREGAGG